MMNGIKQGLPAVPPVDDVDEVVEEEDVPDDGEATIVSLILPVLLLLLGALVKHPGHT